MKRLFPVLLLALLLFGSLQNRARAASTPPEKTASGSPGENPNKHATFNPVLTIQLQRDAAMWGEGTVLDVDVGPNLYTYVRQNPWTKFDPLGLTDEEIWLRSTGKLNAQGLAPGTPYRPPQGLSPRIAGGLQMVGGGAEAAVGLLAVSTGGGAIPGLIAIAHGYDNMQTGLNQMVTGKPQTTMTHQAIRAGT